MLRNGGADGRTHRACGGNRRGWRRLAPPCASGARPGARAAVASRRRRRRAQGRTAPRGREGCCAAREQLGDAGEASRPTKKGGARMHALPRCARAALLEASAALAASGARGKGKTHARHAKTTPKKEGSDGRATRRWIDATRARSAPGRFPSTCVWDRDKSARANQRCHHRHAREKWRARKRGECSKREHAHHSHQSQLARCTVAFSGAAWEGKGGGRRVESVPARKGQPSQTGEGRRTVRVAVEAAATIPDGTLPRLFEAPPITR